MCSKNVVSVAGQTITENELFHALLLKAKTKKIAEQTTPAKAKKNQIQCNQLKLISQTQSYSIHHFKLCKISKGKIILIIKSQDPVISIKLICLFGA